MSYSTIARCAVDPDLMPRVTAALAQEGTDQPYAIAATYMWGLSAATDIEAAYASAVAGGNEHPGGDESVITDGMILAYVQSNPPPAEP